MFKFLHTADIHLDSPLRNLDNYDNVPRDEFRSATRRAFDNIVSLAIREEVRFVLIAGDLYDGDCADFNTPLYIRRKMEELQAEDIRVFIIQGNHDAANNMKKAFKLQLPDNVHLFSTRQPETVQIDELNVAIHGQGFAEKAVEQDLSKNYPEPINGYINIGMLHTNCGAHEGHDPYAPSTVKGLSAKGYQYWALGHIHKPQRLTGPDPWIIYSGNPQGRHIGETGERNCTIATVEDNRIDVRTHAVDVLRWCLLDCDVSDCDDGESVIVEVLKDLAAVAEDQGDLPIAIRIKLTGKTNAHRDLGKQPSHWDGRIREAVLDRFDDRIWVEKIRFKTKSKASAPDVVDSGLQELIVDLGDSKLAENARQELQADFEKMLTSMPHDPRVETGELDLDNDAAMAIIIAEARDMLTSRILTSGAEA
jgi:DNA repair exonuclease SbcCD nuclease subunit